MDKVALVTEFALRQRLKQRINIISERLHRHKNEDRESKDLVYYEIDICTLLSRVRNVESGTCS